MLESRAMSTSAHLKPFTGSRSWNEQGLRTARLLKAAICYILVPVAFAIVFALGVVAIKAPKSLPVAALTCLLGFCAILLAFAAVILADAKLLAVRNGPPSGHPTQSPDEDPAHGDIGESEDRI